MADVLAVRRNFCASLAFLLAAALSGCGAQPGAAPVPGAPVLPQTQELTITMPKDPNSPVIFNYRGAHFTTGVEAEAAVHAAWAAEIATIQPVQPPLGGSVRIILQSPQALMRALPTSQRSDEYNPTLVELNRFYDSSRVEAIRKAALFDSVTVEESDSALPETKGNDFAMWRDGVRGWYIRFGRGNPTLITQNTVGLAPFTQSIRNVGNIQRQRGGNVDIGLQTALTQDGKGVVFTFMGVSYGDINTLSLAVQTELRHETQEIKPWPIADRLGGKVLIVVSTQNVGIHYNLIAGQKSTPEQLNILELGMRAWARAIGQQRAEAWRKANLFDEVKVENADLMDVPIGEYDYVLWQPANAPMTWRFRVTDGDAFNLASPGPTATEQEWVKAAHDQLQKARPEGPALRKKKGKNDA